MFRVHYGGDHGSVQAGMELEELIVLSLVLKEARRRLASGQQVAAQMLQELVQTDNTAQVL